MGNNVSSFDLNGSSVTVTNKMKVVDAHILHFLSTSANGYGSKVIGFDVDWFLCVAKGTNQEVCLQSKCATVNLCDQHSCLIIQFDHLDHFPTSLFNFLRLPNFTFVGVGIKDNLAKLEKHYGIICRNAVEIGELAATVIEKPSLKFCSVDELAHAVAVCLPKRRTLNITSCWGEYTLSKELAELAAVNVYSYYKIGSKLFDYI